MPTPAMPPRLPQNNDASNFFAVIKVMFPF
jgi:hypothetical protein